MFWSHKKTKILRKQESPSVWTQEAYRPPRSYSVSRSPDEGGGRHPTPIQFWWGGVPPSSPKGGYPIQSGERYLHPVVMGSWPGMGTPIQSWGGVPPSSLERGTSIQSQQGDTSIQPWRGLDLGWVPPVWRWDTPHCGPEMVVSLPSWTWDGGCPPPSWPGTGVPPCLHYGVPPPHPTPPSRCGLTHKVKILPSPILRMRAVKILLERVSRICIKYLPQSVAFYCEKKKPLRTA